MSAATAAVDVPVAAPRVAWLSRRALVALFLLTLPLVTAKVRGADEIEYFSYLPSLLLDGDLDFTNEYRHFVDRDPESLRGFRETFLDRREPLTGRPINFAPLGSALLWSPFYLLAHAGVLVARLFGADVAADGFSRPYLAAIAYGSALYGFLALLLAHAALRRFARVPEAAATLAVAGVWLGTPALYYLTLAPGFSHACSMFTLGLVLFLSLRALATPPSVAGWALIGAAVGLAGLVREQDALVGFVPGLVLLAWAWRTRDVRGLLPRGLALVATTVLVFVPQLLAYHAINGRYGPSRLVTRKMSWHSPHALEVLVSPGHGLFVWAPLLVLAVAGLVLAARRRETRAAALLLLAAFVSQVWINGAVESWSQAGAFGSRRFVGLTFAFAFGLGVLLAAAWTRLGRLGSAGLVALFVAWNLGLMVQFGLKLMDRQRLEWPMVAVNQVTEVPRRLGRTAWLFFRDREALVQETR